MTYRLADGRTFIHIAEQAGDEDSPLPGLVSFQEFQAGIRERCDWGPVVEGAEQVGRFSTDIAAGP